MRNADHVLYQRIIRTVEAMPTYHPEEGPDGRPLMERADNAVWIDKLDVLDAIKAAARSEGSGNG